MSAQFPVAGIAPLAYLLLVETFAYLAELPALLRIQFLSGGSFS
jgi:hypothetical protein